jgi:hypothetical protein
MNARQQEAQRMYERALKLENPFDNGPKWIAFESYRENVMDSLNGEFDCYSDSALQASAEETAQEA